MKIKTTLATAAILLGVSAAQGVAAQDTQAASAPAAAPAADPACELHIFPTLEGQAMTTGWLSGFGIVGAVADAAKNKDRNISEAEYLKEALGPRLQVQAMKSIDMVGALKLPPELVDRDLLCRIDRDAEFLHEEGDLRSFAQQSLHLQGFPRRQDQGQSGQGTRRQRPVALPAQDDRRDRRRRAGTARRSPDGGPVHLRPV